MKVLFCLFVLYLFAQTYRFTYWFFYSNSNCWIWSSFLFPDLQDCLGGFLSLTGNDVQTTGHRSLQSAMSRLASGLFSWIPKGRRSLLSAEVSVVSPPISHWVCCAKMADEGTEILIIENSNSRFGTQIFLIWYLFPPIKEGLPPSPSVL